MIRNANTLEEGAELSADLCIIGAGAAGITLARELAGTGRSVLVLEGGGLEQELRQQELYDGDMSGMGTWALSVMRQRRLGGSTNLWAGWCRPFRREDFEVRDWIPYSGWPISYDDVRPHYDQAAEILEIGPFTWDAQAIAAAEGKALLFSPDSDVTTEIFQYSPPVRFGEKYRSDLEEGEGLQVWLDASVVEIRLSEDGRRAERVRCATLDGRRFEVTADRFVLATGGIENARLLLASDRQAPAGVANGTGQVGRWFMEHPHYIRVVGILTPRPLEHSFYRRHTTQLTADGVSRDTSIQGVFGLRGSVRTAERIPDWTASLREYDLEEPGIDGIDVQQLLSTFADAPDPRLYKLTARVEQTPTAESRVTLNPDQRDALGLPRVDLNWQIREEDRQTIRRGFEIFGAELARTGLGRVWVPRREDGTLGWGPGPGGHHMGTTRMGADPATSVVDENGACHEVPNLYIAGSSIYPTGASANPTFTIVALALRLAEHLKQEG